MVAEDDFGCDVMDGERIDDVRDGQLAAMLRMEDAHAESLFRQPAVSGQEAPAALPALGSVRRGDGFACDSGKSGLEEERMGGCESNNAGFGTFAARNSGAAAAAGGTS